MGVPKSKPVPARRRSAKTLAEREAAEMRADVRAYDRAMAEWEAAGRPAPIPWEEAKRQLDRLK